MFSKRLLITLIVGVKLLAIGALAAVVREPIAEPMPVQYDDDDWCPNWLCGS